jgi:hypothetical protein
MLVKADGNENYISISGQDVHSHSVPCDFMTERQNCDNVLCYMMIVIVIGV